MAETKIPAMEIVDGICTEIRAKLLKDSAFSNNSLCYTGARFEFGIRGELFSRGDSTFTMTTDVRMGDPRPQDTSTHVEASGERVAGRRKGAGISTKPYQVTGKISEAAPAKSE